MAKPMREIENGGAGPVIVLVEPQMAENIGMAARAMLNFGLSGLRLVAPRDGWPNRKAVGPASGALGVLEAAEVHDSVESAIADLGFVYATTARPRDMIKEVATARGAAARMAALAAQGGRAGVLFGRERWGLTNDEIALADAIVTFPTNPQFSSLNISQSVLLIAYEWHARENGTAAETLETGLAAPVARADLMRFFEHLECELDAAGFLYPPDKRPTMVRNLRNLFHRARLTDMETRSLRGVVAALAKGRRRREEGAR